MPAVHLVLHTSLIFGIALVLFRVLGFFILAPVLSHQAIPGFVKFHLGLALALAVYPLVQARITVPTSLEAMLFAVGIEVASGLILGFGAWLTMIAIELGGQVIGIQMGFGTAGLMDPQLETTVSLLAALEGVLAMTLFLVASLHHEWIALCVKSYQLIPAQLNAKVTLLMNEHIMKSLLYSTSQVFWVGVQMALPFTMILLGVQALLAILARVLPHMNIFVLSFPVTILAGLLVFWTLAPDVVGEIQNVLRSGVAETLDLLRQV